MISFNHNQQQYQNQHQLQPGVVHRNQQSIRRYTKNQLLSPIINESYIDKNKGIENIRILSINVNDIKITNVEKIQMLIESMNRYQIDMTLITESNMK